MEEIQPFDHRLTEDQIIKVNGPHMDPRTVVCYKLLQFVLLTKLNLPTNSFTPPPQTS